MHKTVALLAMSMIAITGLARAADVDPILMRQTLMDLQQGDLAGISATLKANGDIKKLEFSARAIQRASDFVPAFFPKGSETGHNTKAKPEIWSDTAGFQKASDNLTLAAGKLADAAKTGDADAVAANVKLVEEACIGCHRSYRNR